MMNAKHGLTERLASLQSWRHGLDTQMARVASALHETGFMSADSRARLEEIQALIDHERVTIAFVAEYMRGKSELINALFFADLGRRLLPSGAGRTTRCVTELRFDRHVKTGLKLMPIETRESPRRFTELYEDESQWRSVLFDADNPESMGRALAALSETKRISIGDAVAWGLHGEGISIPTDAASNMKNDNQIGIVEGAHPVDIISGSLDRTSAFVDVPRWRYAVINFPHPLLDAGLVIVDTPGLAALSTEPELAQEHLADADAVLLVLDINTGVMKPDLAIWREHLGGHLGARRDDQRSDSLNQRGHRNLRNRRSISEHDENSTPDSHQARFVVLNKIDELQAVTPDSSAESNRDFLHEIDRRVRETADLLRVDPIRVVPVSARMALTGAFANDTDKILKSRLYQLERSLATHLPRTRQDAQTATITATLSGLIESAQASLDQQRYQALTGLSDLGAVRAKNEKMMVAIVEQTHAKQDRLIATFKELRGIKGVHSKLTEELASLVDLAAAKKDIERAKLAIAASVMSGAVMENCHKYLAVTEEKLDAIELKIAEIRALFSNIGEKMRKEFGLGSMEQFDAHPFATQRFQIELDKAREKAINEFGKTSNLLIRRGVALADQFEDVVADRVLNIFKIAQRESATWMRGLFNSLESPLGELKTRMEQRSTSIDKVKSAELDLAERIAELQAELDVIKRKHEALAEARAGLERHSGKRVEEDAA